VTAKRVVYFASDGLTPALQAVFSHIDPQRVEMTVVVAEHLDFYGLEYDFASSPRVDTVAYAALPLARQPYDFFLERQPTAQLDALLEQARPELIVTQSEFWERTTDAIVRSPARRALGAGVVAFAASGYLPPRWKSPLLFRRYRSIFDAVEILCARTQFELELLQHRRLLAKRRFFVNYWGSNPKLFRPLTPAEREESPFREELSKIPPGSRSLAYIGRLVPEKGLHLLLEALAALPEDYQLLYGGHWNEAYRLRIEAQIDDLKLASRCHYLGNIPYAQLPYVYDALDLLVVPTWQLGKAGVSELFGRVIAEAMLCRRPAIGSRNGSIPEVLNDPSLVFEQNDAAALAAKVEEYFARPAVERAQLIERGYEYAGEHYTSAAHARRLEDVIDRLPRASSRVPRSRPGP
jgi:glycosyltransferase involved in cell wall biosynthesis